MMKRSDTGSDWKSVRFVGFDLDELRANRKIGGECCFKAVTWTEAGLKLLIQMVSDKMIVELRCN